MDFKYLAKKYGTPLYVYDFNYFQQRFLELKEAFLGRKSLIAYAIKANSNLSVIKHFAKLESGADCVSIAEVKRALKAGIKPYKIIFSGVGKKDNEIKSALKYDILFINVESSQELQRVAKIAKNLNKEARISVRVNPDIDPKTHPYISTGLHENKFGVSIDEAKQMYLFAKNDQFLNPIGIHFHIGSQLVELEPIKEASKSLQILLKSYKLLILILNFLMLEEDLVLCMITKQPSRLMIMLKQF